jgi:hypothetical protein
MQAIRTLNVLYKADARVNRSHIISFTPQFLLVSASTVRGAVLLKMAFSTPERIAVVEMIRAAIAIRQPAFAYTPMRLQRMLCYGYAYLNVIT